MTSIVIAPSGTQKVLQNPMERKYPISSPPISFLSMTLTRQLSPSPFWQLLLSDISFLCSCFWYVLQDLSFNHLSILLTLPLSPLFRFRVRSPSFNFLKASWNKFAFYFDSRCPPAEEYSTLSLSSGATLFTSLTLNAVKFSISFGHVKGQTQA